MDLSNNLPKLAKAVKSGSNQVQSVDTVLTKYSLTELTGTDKEDFLDDAELVKEAIVSNIIPNYDDKPAVVTYGEGANSELIASNLIELAKKHSNYKHANSILDSMVDFDAYLAKLYELGVLKQWVIKGNDDTQTIFYLYDGELLTKDDLEVLDMFVHAKEDTVLSKEQLELLNDKSLVARIHHDALSYKNNHTLDNLKTMLSSQYNKYLSKQLNKVVLVESADLMYASSGLNNQMFA